MEYCIRRFQHQDVNDLYQLLSDRSVMEYLEPPYTLQQTVDFLNQTVFIQNPFIYAVEYQQKFIGYVIYHPYDDQYMEIGWVLKKQYWGKGIATTLTQMLVQKANQIGKSALIECSIDQLATKRIALKCGFEYQYTKDELEVYTKQRNPVDLI